MQWISEHLLTLILFLPTAGAVVLLFLPSRNLKLLRYTALTASLLSFILSLAVWAGFRGGLTGFQFEEQVAWYSVVNATYHLGVDGISLALVLLTTFLTPLAILTSFNITDRVKAYMILFLLLETGMLGVFLSLDLLLFFVFWEVGLVPMYFLINQWGGTRRNYASLKFILFTMGGSLGLLLATQMIGVVVGSYDLPVLFERWTAITEGSLFGLPVETVKTITFWAFVVAFAVKVPIFPMHTWLPDAHTEAPTAGSMILAGVLLKLGAYGFLRLVLPLFPQESYQYAGWLALLGALSIIMGGLGAFGQDDFKRLVAYSSINHMGFVVLGIAAAARAIGSTTAVMAVNGAVLQMLMHGLSSAGMFFLVGVLYDRTHTRDLKEFGGLYATLPVYGTILLFVSMASLGLPGLGGFVAEFQVVVGSWQVFPLATAVSMLGLFFTGAYVLKAIKKVLTGPFNEKWTGKLNEITARELVVIIPPMILLLLTGLLPSWIMELINQAVSRWFLS
ncbi:MAG: NADH-quinone oxidoreductase subunit M [Anaerolineae bacterium]|nr:NADH-quinone oxidoreductase subunit M [Anaerolineae bacterium]